MPIFVSQFQLFLNSQRLGFTAHRDYNQTPDKESTAAQAINVCPHIRSPVQRPCQCVTRQESSRRQRRRRLRDRCHRRRTWQGIRDGRRTTPVAGDERRDKVTVEIYTLIHVNLNCELMSIDFTNKCQYYFYSSYVVDNVVTPDHTYATFIDLTRD